MKLDHPTLVDLLQRAYSAEKAAAFAYIGHAASLRDPVGKAAVKQIEDDEWCHRENLCGLMQRYDVPASRWYEVRFYVIGKVIAASCHVVDRNPGTTSSASRESPAGSVRRASIVRPARMVSRSESTTRTKLKSRARRPQDLEDIEALRALENNDGFESEE